MPTRLRLLHDWTQQMRSLLPAVHATRAATYALFVLGIVWSGTVTLLKVAELLTAPGQRWQAPVAIFKEAEWRSGHLTIAWAATAEEPWVRFSDRPGGTARVREYRQRVHAEATYADIKGRGFDLERSKLATPARITRWLLVVHLALWWTFALGLQTVRNGWRTRFDRRDRRDLSLVRLGRLTALEALTHDRLHALPFRQTAVGWVYPWPP
jgi:hypothetical protein